MFYRGLYSYRQRLRVITLFLSIFSYCFCMLSKFAKDSERKGWRVQVAHLNNAARALSSFFTDQNKNCCLYIIIQRNRAANQIWKVLPNMTFSPDLGGKNCGVPSMRMQVLLDSSFCPPGFSPYMGREERRVQGPDYGLREAASIVLRGEKKCAKVS